jgi:hypothetical protein
MQLRIGLLALALLACDDATPNGGADGAPWATDAGTPDAARDGGLDMGAEADWGPDAGPGADAGPGSDGGVATPARATIGPEGGQVALENGTTLIIPPALFESPQAVALIPVARPDTGYDRPGFSPVGPSFRVEPVLNGPGIRLRIPAADGADLRVVTSLSGVVDGRRGAQQRLIHQSRLPHTVVRGVAEFELARVGPAVLSPTRAHFGGPQLKELGDEDAWIIPIIGTCFEALTALGVDAPEGIDARVSVDGTPLALAILAGIDSGRLIQTVVVSAAALRFKGRACLAADQALDHLRGGLGFDLPDRPEITLQFEHLVTAAYSPSPCLPNPGDGWLPVAADPGPPLDPPECGPVYGLANGEGVSLFFNPECVDDAVGQVTGDADEPWFGYNQPGAGPLGQQPDFFEHTMAHELFHWAEDLANGVADGRFGPPVFQEGAADAIAEAVFDAVPSGFVPPPLWSAPAWSDCGRVIYGMSTFWRFVDATQATPSPFGTVAGRALQQVQAAAAANAQCGDLGCSERVTWALLDGVLAEMFPETDGYTHHAALADFAGALLYQHRFERADATEDALGQRLDEETPGELWGPWSGDWGVLNPEPDTVTDPQAITVVAPVSDALPLDAEAFALPPYQARAVTLDLGALVGSGAVSLTVRATQGGAPRTHLGLRLYHQSGAEPSAVAWRLDAVADTPEAPSLHGIAPATFADAHVLVFTNLGDEPLTVTLGLERSVRDVIALSAAGLSRLRAQGTTLTPVPLGPDAEPVLAVGDRPRGLAVAPSGTRALVSDWGDERVRLYSLEPGAERLLASHAFEGARPHHMVFTPDGRFALVTLYYGQAVAVLRVDGPEPVLCEQIPVSVERPFDVVLTPDGQRAYVSLEGRANAPGDRLVLLDIDAATDCAAEPSAVLGEVPLGVGARPGHLAVSPDGALLAVAGRAIDRIILVHTAPTADGHVVENLAETSGRDHRFVAAAQLPGSLAFTSDGQRLYYGHESGEIGSDLSGFGTVRFVHLPPIGERLRGHDAYDVAVRSGVRGLLVDAQDAFLYVGDDNGHITALEPGLWNPGGVLLGDHTGGCWDDGAYHPVPCEPAHTLGGPAIDLRWLR